MSYGSEYIGELLREMYEERSAMMHFDGGLPLEKAEALAQAEVETFRRAIEKREATLKGIPKKAAVHV